MKTIPTDVQVELDTDRMPFNFYAIHSFRIPSKLHPRMGTAGYPSSPRTPHIHCHLFIGPPYRYYATLYSHNPWRLAADLEASRFTDCHDLSSNVDLKLVGAIPGRDLAVASAAGKDIRCFVESNFWVNINMLECTM